MKTGVIHSLSDHLEKHPSVGAVGPLVLNPDESIQVSAQPFPTLFRETWRLFHLDAIFPISRYPARYFHKPTAQPADVLLGACILARKSTLDMTGSFDEQFFVYSEEVDLCLRIRRAGWEIQWLPEASIVHYGGMSTQQAANEMFLELYRNKIRFFRKHYGRQYAGVYKGILWLASVGRLSVFKIVRRVGSSAYEAKSDLEDQYALLYKNLPSL